jgi:hypothetical protein
MKIRAHCRITAECSIGIGGEVVAQWTIARAEPIYVGTGKRKGGIPCRVVVRVVERLTVENLELGQVHVYGVPGNIRRCEVDKLPAAH